MFNVDTDSSGNEVEQLKAHKMVLETKSLHFKNKSGIVDFKTHKIEVVKGLLSFVYKGIVEDLNEIAEDLLTLASMCLVPCLVKCFEAVLINKSHTLLSVPNF